MLKAAFGDKSQRTQACEWFVILKRLWSSFENIDW
jgi:hypothetical protein